MPQEFNNTRRIYMKVSYKGYLYQKVDSLDVEGAYEHTYEGKTSFRKDWRATSYGDIVGFKLKDTDFGQILEIQIQTNLEEVEVLSIPRLSNKGLNPFYRDLASKMGNIDWSRKVSFAPNTSKYRTNKDGSPRINRKSGEKMLIPSLWINYSREEYVPLKYKFARRGETPKENEIPHGEYIQGLNGEEYSSKIPDMFLDAKMKEAIQSFEDFKNSKSIGNESASQPIPQPTPQPIPKSVETSSSNEDDDDDLPF